MFEDVNVLEGFGFVLDFDGCQVVGGDGEELCGVVEDLVVLIVLIHEEVDGFYFGVSVDALGHDLGEVGACC